MPSTYLRDYLESLQRQTSEQRRLQYAANEFEARARQRQNEQQSAALTGAFENIGGAIQKAAVLKYQTATEADQQERRIEANAAAQQYHAANQEERWYMDAGAELWAQEAKGIQSGLIEYEHDDDSRAQLDHYGGELDAVMNDLSLSPKQKYASLMQVWGDLNRNLLPHIRATRPPAKPTIVPMNGRVYMQQPGGGEWTSDVDLGLKFQNDELVRQEARDQQTLKRDAAEEKLQFDRAAKAYGSLDIENPTPEDAIKRIEDISAVAKHQSGQPYVAPPDPDKAIPMPRLMNAAPDFASFVNGQTYTLPDGSEGKWDAANGTMVPLEK